MVLDLGRDGMTEAEARLWTDDAAFLHWCEGAGAIVIANELKVFVPFLLLFVCLEQWSLGRKDC